jgi:hypothetical protein
MQFIFWLLRATVRFESESLENIFVAYFISYRLQDEADWRARKNKLPVFDDTE